MGQSLDRKRRAMTDAFIAAIETAGRWLPDWISHRAANFITGKLYRGINSIMLPVRQMQHGWTSPLYAGLGQIKGAGGRVKDAEFRNSSWVIFWGQGKDKLDPITGEVTEKGRRWPKVSRVWNLDQCEGVKESRIKGLPESAEGADTIEAAETLLRGYMDAESIRLTDGDPAYYPTLDCISMPGHDAFHTTEGYYNALGHECIHSTAPVYRCDRDQPGHQGGPEYSREELVAQMGAAFLRADLGLGTDEGADRDAAYLASWLKALKADPAMLHQAASAADKAVSFIGEKAGVAKPETADA